MKNKLLVILLLAMNTLAVSNGDFYKVERLQYEGVISSGEGPAKSYLGIYSFDVNGEEVYGYEFTTWGRRRLKDNDYYYVKFEDRSQSQPQYHNDVVQEQGSDKDVRFISDFIPESEVVTVKGKVKSCKVRSSFSRRASIASCVKGYYFKGRKMKALIGKKVKVTFQKGIKNSPCWLASSILYPAQCSRKPVRQIISLEKQ